MTVPAADIGDGDTGVESFHHSIECRKPFRHQTTAVSVAVECRHATSETSIVFAPRHASYVQRLRVEDAKRRLERTQVAIEEVSWQVGYEDAAFFRRLFKRTTDLTPGAYRKRFRLPEFTRTWRDLGLTQPSGARWGEMIAFRCPFRDLGSCIFSGVDYR